MNDSNAEILDFFLVEANEHVQTISDGLLVLEKNPADLGLVDKIFREIHAVKGSSGMIGFSTVSQFAHKIEDLLSRLRDQKLPVSAAVVDLLFQTMDILAQQIEQIAAGEETDNTILATFDTLAAKFLGRPAAKPAPPQKKTPPPPVPAPAKKSEQADVTLAERYVSQNLFDKAAAVYREMLQANPRNAAIRQRLAETLALQAYLEEIAAAAKKPRGKT